MNILPFMNFYVLVIIYAAIFTVLNLRGIHTSAKVNEGICWALLLVVLIFVVAVIRYIGGLHTYGPGFFTNPFYNPNTFDLSNVFAGTSIAVLTYIGFDAISTLSEEARDPTRDILRATVITCLVIGFLSAIEVYLAQLVWGAHGSQPFPTDQVESAFVLISKQAGGVVLFQVINLSILVATLGSGMGAQLAAGRLLYGMGRGNALPKNFFGVIDPVNQVPRNGIITVGVIALIGVCVLEGVSKSLGGGAYEHGVQLLNFGALLGFVGVNAANVVHYWVRAQEKRLVNLLPGVVGFIVCAALWLSLGLVAKILGLIWLAFGIVYGYVKTNGFRGNLITFG
jgi:amino acid transporter